MSRTLKYALMMAGMVVFFYACNDDDAEPKKAPSVSTAALTNITTTSATGGGTITDDGNSTITASGIVLSRGNAEPTLEDTVFTNTVATGSFTVSITGLEFDRLYYIRAYATNKVGTSYGEAVTLNTTNDDSRVRFIYNGEEVDYGIIVSPTTGEKWLDRNLGASQVAMAFDDALAFGDYFQWGRFADGHQLKTSTISSTLSATDLPGHGNFIVNGISDTWYDWRAPQNDSLWQKSRINNPCPTGWHVPTRSEWENETAITDLNSAFQLLKLAAAGQRNQGSGALEGVGSYHIYWSSSMPPFPEPHNSYNFFVYSGGVFTDGAEKRATGLQIRCIKN